MHKISNLVLLAACMFLMASCHSADYEQSLKGASRDEIIQRFGSPVVPPIQRSDGLVVFIFFDRKAEQAATDRADGLLCRMGTEVLMKNGKVVYVFPIMGQVYGSRDNLHRENTIAQFYAVSDSNNGGGVTVFSVGKRDYRHDSSMPSMSVEIKDVMVSDRIMPNGVESIVRVRCVENDYGYVKKFMEEVGGGNVVMFINRKFVCFGVVNYSRELNWLEITSEQQVSEPHKLTKARGEP